MTDHIPERLQRQAASYSRFRAFFTRRRSMSMVGGLRIGFDAVYASAGPRCDVACGYLGGDTPHVWSSQEWASRPERWRLTIWVRDYAANGTVDGAEAKRRAEALGQPYGTWIAWDAEGLVNPAYHNDFAAAVAPYLVPTYGEESTVYGNPPPHWVAAWNNVAGLLNGESHQFASANAFDSSAFPPDAPLWDTQGPTPSPVPQPRKRAKPVWFNAVPGGQVFVTDGIYFRWLISPDDYNKNKYLITASGANFVQADVKDWHFMGMPADPKSAAEAQAGTMIPCPWPTAA